MAYGAVDCSIEGLPAYWNRTDIEASDGSFCSVYYGRIIDERICSVEIYADFDFGGDDRSRNEIIAYFLTEDRDVMDEDGNFAFTCSLAPTWNGNEDGKDHNFLPAIVCLDEDGNLIYKTYIVSDVSRYIQSPEYDFEYYDSFTEYGENY